MKRENHSTQTMLNINGQLDPSDSFKALFIAYLPQIIAATGVFLLGLAALIKSLS